MVVLGGAQRRSNSQHACASLCTNARAYRLIDRSKERGLAVKQVIENKSVTFTHAAHHFLFFLSTDAKARSLHCDAGSQKPAQGVTARASTHPTIDASLVLIHPSTHPPIHPSIHHHSSRAGPSPR